MEFQESLPNSDFTGSQTVNLHIGVPKTGSTAIQFYGIENHRHLLAHDVYYFPNHFINTWYGRGHHYPMDIVDDPKSLQEIRRSNCRNIIISSEGMADYTQPQIEKLTNYFSDFSVRVIIYIRRQDHLFHSLYNQYVKWRYYCKVSCDVLADNMFALENCRIQDFFDVSDDQQVIQQIKTSFDMLSFYNIINQWSLYVGKDNVVVRIYEKDKLCQNNIVSDFYGLFRINATPNLSLANRSLNDHYFTFLYAFNQRAIDHQHSSAIRENLSKLIWDLNETDDSEVTSNSNRLSHQNRQHIVDYYADGNKMIGDEYFNIGQVSPFNDIFPSEEESDTAPNDTTLRIAFDVIEHYIRENEHLAIETKNVYENSFSWRLTKPVRYIGKKLNVLTRLFSQHR